ncbi:DUF126 domain-containing protein [[Clostridium] symbiosum]|uniref:aconitase X swivel domain-containing protein n=1 Tax=Clostridium symbiosum TaxID=1512 RepID=UPI001D087301|nr:DUF126 domain-containing protein [[Clostridium] symbiosum]MCB6609460.1 DUF126 domain-containing protein [[Clostridium] symbiosum]MCB6929168.1 DUF126 domain-containing protein [[Clostridium] symbiosum]
MERTYNCSKIAKGTAKAEALVSKDAVCFYLVVPETGELIERNHDINGKNVAGKILIMPSGKGSSVVQADGLYKLLMKGKHPAGLIVETADTVLVTAAVAMEIPMVHKVDPEFFNEIKNGELVTLDSENGVIKVEAI